jgi:ABC-type glycerol-3-phosphate transport system permease component
MIAKRSLVVIFYIIFLMLPIYWLLNMSFKTTNEILGGFSAYPREFTLDSYRKIFTDPSWYGAYINSITYVAINTVISVIVALPAAYAFSRYRFLGDKHLFFWLLSNRMAPAAVFVLPFVNLYSAVGLFDTPWAVAFSHTLFNVPLAVWILEGFMSGVPKERDGLCRRLFLPAVFPAHLHSDDFGRHWCGGVLLLHVFVGRNAAGKKPHFGCGQTHRGRHDEDCKFGRL